MQHYTRNTVEVSEWCRKCGKHTRHRVDSGRLGPCLDCMRRPTPPATKPAIEVESEQMDLFGGKPS